MAKKGKSKSGGNKKKGDGENKEKEKKKDDLICLFDIPKYEDPKEKTGKVKIKTTIGEPEVGILTIRDEYFVNQKLEVIIEQVKELHQGSINNIKLSKNRYNFNNCFDNQKTFEQQGLVGSEEICLFYDFKPICHPILQ